MAPSTHPTAAPWSPFRLAVLAAAALGLGVPLPAWEGSVPPTERLARDAAAQEQEPDLQQIGGATTAVVAAGGVAFVGVGPRVLAYDLETGASPERIGQTDVLAGVVEGLALEDGGLLYASIRAAEDGAAELVAFDARDPRRARRLGTGILPVSEIGALAVAGKHVYTLTDAGLVAVDVKDPFAPRAVSTVAIDGRPDAGGGLATDDGLLVVARPTGLFMYGLDDPSRPARLGRHPAAGTSVALVGRRAAVAGPAGLVVLDLALPGAPRELARVAGARGPASIAAAGDRAVVAADGGRTAIVYDLSVPDAPRPTHEQPLAGFSSTRVALALHGDMALVVLGEAGLVTMPLEGPNRPELPFEPILPPIDDLAVAGDHAYAAAGPAGLFVLGPDGAGGWRVEGALPTWSEEPFTISRLVHRASRVYAYDARGALVVVDVTLPSRPTIVASQPLPAREIGAGDLAFVGESPTLVVSGGDGSLRVVDVAVPEAPREIAAVEGLDLYALTAAGSHAYGLGTLPLGGATVLAFDLTDPGRPVSVGDSRMVTPFGRPSVSGNLLLLGGGYGHVAIVDVAAPDRPREIGRLDFLPAGRVDHAGGRLFAAHVAGVDAIDILDPAYPRQVDRRLLPWSRGGGPGSGDAYVDGGRVHVLRADAGLYTIAGLSADTSVPGRAFLPSAFNADPRGESSACGARLRRVVFVVDVSADMAVAPRPAEAAVLLGSLAESFGDVALDVVRYGGQAERLDPRDGLAPAAALDGLDAPGRATAGRVDLGLAAAAEVVGGPSGAVVVIAAGRPDARTRALAEARASELREAGVRLMTIGIGPDADTDLLGRNGSARTVAEVREFICGP